MKIITIVPYLFLGLVSLSTGLATAWANQIYIPVGQARIKKSIIGFPDTKILKPSPSGTAELATLSRTVKEQVLADLNFTHLFIVQNPSAFIEKQDTGITLDSFKISDWTTIGTEFLIKTGIELNGKELQYEMRLYDVLGSKQIVGKRYSTQKSELRNLAHHAANDIIEALTGKAGIFLTKIAMVCDKTGKKEIWVTDFDGSNPRQITNHGTLAFSPEWHPDQKKIVYSVYTKNAKNIKNIDLHEIDVTTQKSRLLSNRKGINSGSAFSPDGKKIALTMSFLGNPEIFVLDPVSLEVTRLTEHWADDVDPAWSPDGSKIAFVSSRANLPMVYTMNPDGSQVTRITFAGKFNATPDWAPNGKKLVFASYVDSRFDLFLMNPDGTNLERLTRNEGSNEDPHFSPDGNFIAFTSNRTGQKNIYVITVDGMNTRRITHGLGNCEAPRWGGYPVAHSTKLILD